MKKFMEELANAKAYHSDLPGENSEAQRKFRELRDFYAPHVGKRALYKAPRGESRVVRIEQVTDSYIRLSYAYHGRDYNGRLQFCSTYGALICGDDRLEVS